MHFTLLVLHSLFRWLVLALLLCSVYRAFVGYVKSKTFSNIDNSLRHWTATIAHIQLIIGMVLYFQSPIVKFFWNESDIAIQAMEITFYGLIHILIMFTAIVILTIGSSLSKRKKLDKEKHKTMFIWFVTALLLIFIAVPWEFSPLSNRPYFRTFS